MALSLTNLESIGHVIQLSVAPVFLLTGVGSTLNVLVGRLVRIVDRARVTETQLASAAESETVELNERLSVLAERARLISRAITFSVLCAVLVPSVVVSLFISVLLEVNLATLITIEFIVGLISLVIGLIYFLREVFVATAALSFSSSGGGAASTLRRVVKRS